MELLFGFCIAFLVISVIFFAVALASGEVTPAIISLAFAVAFLFGAGGANDGIRDKNLNNSFPAIGYGVVHEINNGSVTIDSDSLSVDEKFENKYNFTLEGFGIGDIVKYKHSGNYLVDIEHVLVVEDAEPSSSQ